MCPADAQLLPLGTTPAPAAARLRTKPHRRNGPSSSMSATHSDCNTDGHQCRQQPRGQEGKRAVWLGLAPTKHIQEAGARPIRNTVQLQVILHKASQRCWQVATSDRSLRVGTFRELCDFWLSAVTAEQCSPLTKELSELASHNEHVTQTT